MENLQQALTMNALETDRLKALLNKKNTNFYELKSIFAKERRAYPPESKQNNIYRILEDACSMVLAPDNRAAPFTHSLEANGYRSARLEDFSTEDITFLSGIIPLIESRLLRARLADIVWTKQRPQQIDYALTALDAYMETPLTIEEWFLGGNLCWERAIDIAHMLKDNTKNELNKIEQMLLTTIFSSSYKNGSLALELTNLLIRKKLGKAKLSDLAMHLENIARDFESQKLLIETRGYLSISKHCYSLLNNKDKEIKCTLDIADTWQKEATANKPWSKAPNLLASQSYENAIRTLRKIPKASREKYNLTQKIAHLQKVMNLKREEGLKEIPPPSMIEFDFSDFDNEVEQKLSGKNLHDALNSLTCLTKWNDYQDALSKALDQIEQYPLTGLFGSSHLSNDGRVIARTPSRNFDAPLTAKNETVILAMIQNYSLRIEVIYKAYLVPALNLLRQQHKITKADFLAVVESSAIVPPNRKSIIAKGLHAGYNNDFIVALHLLTPQLENIVRFHLKKTDAITTTLSAHGIEHENGLSTLVELPEMDRVFGKDISFEIKALFCTPLGANIRNEIAHGLLDDNHYNSSYGIYAWWLILKLILNPSWNKCHSSNKKE